MEGGGELALDLLPDQSGESVEIRITDSGCGIPPGNLEKLFTPFFSTKPHGTGLGLAVSYGIVKDHCGDIRVAGQPGQGAVFSVVLPLRQAAGHGGSDV
jgi:two-component system NtrC family sensor kinase